MILFSVMYPPIRKIFIIFKQGVVKITKYCFKVSYLLGSIKELVYKFTSDIYSIKNKHFNVQIIFKVDLLFEPYICSKII